MNIKPISVSQLNKYIKRLVSTDFLLNSIDVEGEISNYKEHSSGTIYFSLKDQGSKIRCIVFKSETFEEELEDGMKVIVSGAVSVYDKEGTYQIVVSGVSRTGEGKLYEDFIKLKSKLEKEGLFKESKKKLLPMVSKKVALITSETGATIKDMIINIKRRNNSTNIVVYPSTMQGVKSSKSIIQSLIEINMREDIDCIIIGRGGGSIEDLWTFNDEELAREIYNSKIPVISAVGHETDFTICDFVADKRASTPSVAAELVSVKKIDLLLEMDSLIKKLEKNIERKILENKNRLNLLEKSITGDLLYRNINQYKHDIKDSLFRMKEIIISNLYKRKLETERNYEKLLSLNPKKILNIGYTIVQDDTKNIITSKDKLEQGENITLFFKDGTVKLKNIEIGSVDKYES